MKLEYIVECLKTERAVVGIRVILKHLESYVQNELRANYLRKFDDFCFQLRVCHVIHVIRTGTLLYSAYGIIIFHAHMVMETNAEHLPKRWDSPLRNDNNRIRILYVLYNIITE